MKIYFSDFFNIDPVLLDAHGAFNVSLINDLPVFIDPFLLFNSDKPNIARSMTESSGTSAFFAAYRTAVKLTTAS